VSTSKGIFQNGLEPAMLAVLMGRESGSFGRVVRGERGRGWRIYIPIEPRYLYGIGGRRFPSKQLARTILNAIRVEIAKGTTPTDAIEPYLPARRPEHRLVTKAQAWLALQERRCAAGDLSPTYIRELRRHLDPEGWFSWWGNAPAKGVIKGHAEDWSLWLADQGLGPNTRRKCLQTLRSVLLWLEDREEIHRAPRMPRIEVPEYRPRVIEPEEQARIVAAVPEALRGIYLALCHGIRPGEARALNVEDYDVTGQPEAFFRTRASVM